MSDIKDFSPTAANNNSAPPDGAPEGMAPSTVNNVIREVMAAIRRQWDEAEWFNDGITATFASGTEFTLPTDETDRYHVGRRIRAEGSTTGTIYGKITASTFTTVSEITVEWDTGSLQNEALEISLSIISAVNNSIDYDALADDLSREYIDFDQAPAAGGALGRLIFDATRGTLQYGVSANFNLEIGQEQLVLFRNNTGSTITKGKVVYGTGSTGTNLTAALADNTSDATSERILGVVAEDVANGADGFAISHGRVTNLDTSALTEGAYIYLNGSGGFTETLPTSPDFVVRMGYVIRSNASVGSIYVQIRENQTIDELSLTNITSPADSDFLVHDGNEWVNETASQARTSLNLPNLYVDQDSEEGAANLPKGTTAQRPGSPVTRMVRFNTTTGDYEAYRADGTWGPFGGSTNEYRYIYTATASQTSFTGADDNAQTLDFAQGDSIFVFQEGILLTEGDDYTVTNDDLNPDEITLVVGATSGDEIKIVVFTAINLVNALRSSDIGDTVQQYGAILDDAISYNSIGRKNFIPNGVPPFVNEEGNKTGFANSDFIADIVKLQNAGATSGVYSAQVVTGGALTRELLRIAATTGETTISAGTLVGMTFSIEGLDASPLFLGQASAKTVTLSFKHSHTETGIYCVGLYNAALNRYYIFEYTQSVSNAVETHTETILLDTTGTWAVDNSLGLAVRFVAQAGSNFYGTADAWTAGSAFCTSNQTNSLQTATNQFRITNVQLEIGEVATDPEYIDYGEKLASVQRYLQFFGQGHTGFAATAGAVRLASVLPVEMRATPALSLTDTSIDVNCTGVTSSTGSSITNQSSDSKGLHYTIDGFSGLTAGDPAVSRQNFGKADARL